MTRLSLFNSPLFLGFDQFERAVDRISKSASDSYPPYNVEQLAEDRLRITLAVAGFAAHELDVQVEDNQLAIHGRQAEDDQRVYLHRGIATRQFQRTFVLADGIEVVGANLDNGLLQIELERPRVEPQVRSIAITSGSSGTAVPTAKAAASRSAGGRERAKAQVEADAE